MYLLVKAKKKQNKTKKNKANFKLHATYVLILELHWYGFLPFSDIRYWCHLKKPITDIQSDICKTQFSTNVAEDNHWQCYICPWSVVLLCCNSLSVFMMYLLFLFPGLHVDVIALSYYPQHRWQMCWTELKEEHLDVPRAAHKAHFRESMR